MCVYDMKYGIGKQAAARTDASPSSYVLQCVAVYYNVLQCVLQCVAVCCSVLQCTAVCCRERPE